ncbi:hypothetical protein J7E81_09810 [Bacillus sp. ISL-18]|uniref:hypothetical protein n=1 Tax=Bacillus sp. ISL-18 TaxID=2819118 RepID=UPI001BE90717|nr:hypothetical protein [Bacillus sp. ISL-18]MBT2655524.1 hypothetical protein [Bacillus sp. ISL-18]
MAENEHVLGVIHFVLAILWICFFIKSKRNHTVNYIHIMLLLFAVGILINTLFNVMNRL